MVLFLYKFFTSLSEESDRLKIFDFTTFLGGGGNRFLGSFRAILGTLMLPFGGLLAFMKAPTNFLPVADGWWMMAISLMILSMSGVSAAVVWDMGGRNLYILCMLLIILFTSYITLVLLSRPSFLTGALASRTGLYSSGMLIGVPV